MNLTRRQGLFAALLGSVVSWGQDGSKAKHYTVCEAISERHRLSLKGPVSIVGVDDGDGPLRDECARFLEIDGFQRVAAAWIPDEGHDDGDLPLLGSSKYSMTLRRYLDLTARENRAKGRRLRRRVLIIGHVRVKKEDVATPNKRATVPFAGFGPFGLYPIEIQVVTIEVKGVVGELPLSRPKVL